MPELNPVTRTRLWYITAFLAMDAVVALYVAATAAPTDSIAMYSVAFGLITGTSAGALGSFLIATKVKIEDLRTARSRE